MKYNRRNFTKSLLESKKNVFLTKKYNINLTEKVIEKKD
jgi:hypothetical protein